MTARSGPKPSRRKRPSGSVVELRGLPSANAKTSAPTTDSPFELRTRPAIGTPAGRTTAGHSLGPGAWTVIEGTRFVAYPSFETESVYSPGSSPTTRKEPSAPLETSGFSRFMPAI